MKVLNLGSSGQIGAYLTEYLREKGHTVHEFDKVNDPHWQDLTINDNSLLMEKIIDSDFVFFLAFDVGGSRYLKKYQHTFKFINNNTRMMANVFNLLEKTNKRFVFASSQMSNMSYSPYGVMKRVGEMYTSTLGGLTVKFWNVYGIEKDHEKSHVITDFIRKGFEHGDFDMMTDGTEERQFLYAEDCCEALETIIMGQFNLINRPIKITPGIAKDSVQLDKRNDANMFIKDWWLPTTNLQDGIAKVFDAMKNDYV